MRQHGIRTRISCARRAGSASTEGIAMRRRRALFSSCRSSRFHVVHSNVMLMRWAVGMQAGDNAINRVPHLRSAQSAGALLDQSRCRLACISSYCVGFLYVSRGRQRNADAVQSFRVVARLRHAILRRTVYEERFKDNSTVVAQTRNKAHKLKVAS